jgi:hypothetical protein
MQMGVLGYSGDHYGLFVLGRLRLSFLLLDSLHCIWLLVSGGSQIADWLVSLRKDEVVRCRGSSFAYLGFTQGGVTKVEVSASSPECRWLYTRGVHV